MLMLKHLKECKSSFPHLQNIIHVICPEHEMLLGKDRGHWRKVDLENSREVGVPLPAA